VNAFSDDLRSRLTAGGVRELEQLKQFKKVDVEFKGKEFDSSFFISSSFFCKGLMLEKQYSIDSQKIAEYFPLETTLMGMLVTFGHSFGLVFKEIVGEHKNE
jgi:metallopeptidase MepB